MADLPASLPPTHTPHTDGRGRRTLPIGNAGSSLQPSARRSPPPLLRGTSRPPSLPPPAAGDAAAAADGGLQRHGASPIAFADARVRVRS